jgi:RNA polymerase sigma-70 factor (ECF subfamily)
LFKIVSNVCMTEMRKRSRRDMPMDVEMMEQEHSASEDAEELAVGKVFWGELERSVRSLPEVYRTVVVLRDVYGLSGEETAEMLGVSPGAVKVRLHRARRRLRDELASQFPEWASGDERETA